jgi:hypothetical protein
MSKKHGYEDEDWGGAITHIHPLKCYNLTTDAINIFKALDEQHERSRQLSTAFQSLDMTSFNDIDIDELKTISTNINTENGGQYTYMSIKLIDKLLKIKCPEENLKEIKDVITYLRGFANTHFGKKIESNEKNSRALRHFKQLSPEQYLLPTFILLSTKYNKKHKSSEASPSKQDRTDDVSDKSLKNKGKDTTNSTEYQSVATYFKIRPDRNRSRDITSQTMNFVDQQIISKFNDDTKAEFREQFERLCDIIIKNKPSLQKLDSQEIEYIKQIFFTGKKKEAITIESQTINERYGLTEVITNLGAKKRKTTPPPPPPPTPPPTHPLFKPPNTSRKKTLPSINKK